MGTRMYFCVAIVSVVVALSTTSAAAVSVDGADYNNDVYQQLLRRVENLENRDHQQQQEIDALREELTTEKDRTAVLERNLAQLQMKFVERPGNDDATTVPVDTSTEAAGNGEEAMKQHQPDSGEGEPTHDVRLVKLQGVAPSRIQRHAGMLVYAFHATLTSDLQHTGSHQTIVFDHVVTNIGNAYTPHLGTFVAPMTGVYVFHTTIMVDHHHTTHASIVKNGASIANLYINGDDLIYGTDSAMVVVHLNKDDDVMVQNNDADISLNGDHYTMFSGFLLYPEHADIPIAG